MQTSVMYQPMCVSKDSFWVRSSVVMCHSSALPAACCSLPAAPSSVSGAAAAAVAAAAVTAAALGLRLRPRHTEVSRLQSTCSVVLD